ncbi:MAG: DUF559 domain-containing protein [Solirubrobacterales bacterium]|nr:MAG: DUF559 domain-containing protein [Solirubrobacterales bacterium]
MANKRQAPLDRSGVVDVASARANFRQGRYAPVDVGDVVSTLSDRRGELPLTAIADRQHGLVLTRQLHQLGLAPSTISRRVERGRLHPLYRGVYLVGRRTTTAEGAMLAAVLAIGPQAALAHRSSLRRWGLLAAQGHGHHVISPKDRRNRRDLTVHQASGLHTLDLAAIASIPLTAPARSLLDFAVDAEPEVLEEVLSQARALRLLGPRELDQLRGRTPGHHGWGPLNRILTAERGPDFSRSEAERRLLALIRAAGLPLPRRNMRLHGLEVDFFWPEMGLAIEVDGFAYHGDRDAFERDRARDADLGSRGIEVSRFTWRQIVDRPHWVVARLSAAVALAQARASGQGR